MDKTVSTLILEIGCFGYSKVLNNRLPPPPPFTLFCEPPPVILTPPTSLPPHPLNFSRTFPSFGHVVKMSGIASTKPMLRCFLKKQSLYYHETSYI